MAVGLSLQNVSLQAICQEQGEVFGWLSKEKVAKNRLVRTLTGEAIFPSQSTKMYCGRVRNVVVFGKSYVTDQPERAVFLDQSHRNYHQKEFFQYYVSDVLNEKAERPIIDQECCFIGGFSGDVKFFGHYIFEFLYRLAAFDMCGALDKYPVAVFDEIPESWLSFIELYGVPRNRILRVPQHPSPQFSKVWIASCPNFLAANKQNYSFWDDGIHHFRKRIIERAAEQSPSNQKRVFLGRKDAQHRKLVNEDTVWELLSSIGFVYPEFVGRSAAEQVSAVSSAEIIVSVTGSNSSMTQFAPSNCSIIDIVPPNISGGLGSLGFAAVLGQTYTRAAANVVPGNLSSDGVNSDIEVDIASLRKCLSLALKQG